MHSAFVFQTPTVHTTVQILWKTLLPLWPQLIPILDSQWTQVTAHMAHYRFISTTGGKIIHASKVHNPKARRGTWQPEATTEKRKKKVSTAGWPSAALQIKAFISRPHRRLTSNFCFSLWSLRVSGLRLKARLLSSRRPKFSKRCTAESWRGKTSFLSYRGKKKKKNSNRLKHFRLIATGIKTQQIFLGHPHSDEVKVGSNNSGTLIVHFFGLPLCPSSLVNEIILQQCSAACYS